MTRARIAGALLALAFTVLLGALVSVATATAAEVDEGLEGASWRLEQPPPPAQEGESPEQAAKLEPIGLGHIGDVEFFAPNRGLLITAGNGSTVHAGVWAYDGGGWKELANVCGATNGRIAWAAQNEFWTISDGRPGQAHNPQSGELPPLEDDTLCHFAGGQVVGSYAKLAFQADSYEAMDAAGCIKPDDCWFGGAPLSPQQPVTGAFHLHWNGATVSEEPYEGESQAVTDMRPFGERLYESVRVTQEARVTNSLEKPPVLHAINGSSSGSPFENIRGEVVAKVGAGETAPGQEGHVPLYVSGEFVEALGPLHLSADESGLWAAANAEAEVPLNSKPGQVTVVRDAPVAGEEDWQQLLGPATEPSGEALFPHDVVQGIAAEPGSESAWIALDSESDARNPSPTAKATVARISADGAVSDEQTLPSQAEEEAGVGAKGAASRITCPAVHDCWLATTQGWLFHLTTGDETLPIEDEGFSSLITSRPVDEGLPQVPPDAPPEDDSGLLGELPLIFSSPPKATKAQTEARTTVPLVSHVHSRLLHRTTLELRFHLAVKARVRLIAQFHGRTVASTPMRTLGGGDRALRLLLNPSRWPTKLDLQTHALVPLPTIASSNPSVETISTGLSFPRESVHSILGPQF